MHNRKPSSPSSIDVESTLNTTAHESKNSKTTAIPANLKQNVINPNNSENFNSTFTTAGKASSVKPQDKHQSLRGSNHIKPLKSNYNSHSLLRDYYVQFVLFVVSWFVRFYRLGFPAAVVFDEYHFGTFVDNILSGATHFDIHPPLGKLTLAVFGWFVGYRPDPNFGYDSIGKEYNGVLYYALREVSAIFGVITVPLMYATARELGISWVSSLLCAVLFCFDNLNVIESRLILMDSQITFYLVLSLYCALKLWKTKPRSWSRFFWLTATGLICGCSISVKWTALATPGLIAIVSFFALHFLEEPLTLLECLWAAFIGLGWYCILFFIHFKTLTRSGPGVAFFPSEFRATLIGEENYDPSVKRKPFFELLFYLNKYMFTANAGITTRHHWESYWYQWILNWRGLLYYNKQIDGKWASVYLLCNPVVCIACAICVGLFVIGRLTCVRYRGLKSFRSGPNCSVRDWMRVGTFLFWGWLVNLLPYMLVDRSAFIYHYLPGLIYAQLLCGVMVDLLPMKVRALVTAALLLAVIATFIYFAPWTYCFPLTSEEHALRRWYGRWD